MSFKIEKVTVRIACSKSPYNYPACDDPDCATCRGSGSYPMEMDWLDLMMCVREELDPGPVSA